ncbi:MAG: hypothetical protein OEY34_07970 [Cyclobacteriaceae bacterium]|nr:hypothetical protein [Cyclobacteriaceae bacterium]
MKFTLHTFLLLFTLLTLTSCFDVIDEITLNEDGSGEFLLTVNMSKSKSKLNSIMLLDSINGFRVPSKEEIINNLEAWVDYLENSEGLSRVNKTHNFEDFIFTLGFHFRSVDDINRAIENINFKNKRSEPLNLKYTYDKKNKRFTRYYEPNAEDKENYTRVKEKDKQMFNEAIYISICRFKADVASCTNNKAVISKSGKAVMLKTPAVTIFQGNNTLTNTIQLK